MCLSSPAPGCAPLWDYTYTPEITLTLLNCFRINLKKFTYTYTYNCFQITNVIGALPRVCVLCFLLRPPHILMANYIQGLRAIPRSYSAKSQRRPDPAKRVHATSELLNLHHLPSKSQCVVFFRSMYGQIGLRFSLVVFFPGCSGVFF